MSREVSFFVEGTPAPQGSKSMGISKAGKPYMYEQQAKALRDWRRAVRNAAKLNRNSWVRQVPLHVGLRFVLPATNGQSDGWCAVVPDLDKLTRAVLDALTEGGALVDDAQVVKLSAQKVRGAETGVLVIIRDLV